MNKGKLILSMILVMTAAAATTSANAQSVKGKNYVNAGIGIGTYGLHGTGGLPITASYEHGFTDQISAGLYLGYVGRKYADDWKYSYRIIGVRGSYHFNELLKITEPKLDVYGGVAVFHRGFTLKYEAGGEKYKATDGDISVGIHAAARYMFADNIGAYAEIGYGLSPLQLGVSFVF
ncbi:outer membrane beta-barrel protein [Terrimonas alba]|uniref:outer membrane beta-barrel protein n=1 Tax=Terrimonas alba TaxID=3349636 RepID=UPI0035F2C36D